jgi:RNA polymerase-associated protein
MNDEFTLVDCCVTPILWRLKALDIKLPERSTKAMQKYMQSMFERPAFRDSLTEAELEMNE